MRLLNLSIALVILLTVFLLGCKGEKGDVGPAGPAGPTGPSGKETLKEGFIKCNVAGSLLDGSNFNYNLNFQGISSNMSNNYRLQNSVEEKIFITINKTYAGDADMLDFGSFTFKFACKSLSDLSVLPKQFFSLQINKDLGNNKYLQTGATWDQEGGNGGSVTFSGLSFDASTSVLTGNFSASFPANESRGSLTITNGSFSSKIVNLVARESAY